MAKITIDTSWPDNVKTMIALMTESDFQEYQKELGLESKSTPDNAKIEKAISDWAGKTGKSETKTGDSITDAINAWAKSK